MLIPPSRVIAHFQEKTQSQWRLMKGTYTWLALLRRRLGKTCSLFMQCLWLVKMEDLLYYLTAMLNILVANSPNSVYLYMLYNQYSCAHEIIISNMTCNSHTIILTFTFSFHLIALKLLNYFIPEKCVRHSYQFFFFNLIIHDFSIFSGHN